MGRVRKSEFGQKQSFATAEIDTIRTLKNCDAEVVVALIEKLRDFAGALSVAATDAPDDYPSWGYTTYETNMADLKDLWSQIRPKLKRDLERADFVDAQLHEAFAAFEANEKNKGRKAILAIYNLDVKQFR